MRFCRNLSKLDKKENVAEASISPIYLTIHWGMPSTVHYSPKHVVGDMNRRAEGPARVSCSLDPRTQLGFLSKSLKDHPRETILSQMALPSKPSWNTASFHHILTQPNYRDTGCSLSTQHLLDAKRAVPWRSPYCLCKDLRSAPLGQGKGGSLERDKNQAMFC